MSRFFRCIFFVLFIALFVLSSCKKASQLSGNSDIPINTDPYFGAIVGTYNAQGVYAYTYDGGVTWSPVMNLPGIDTPNSINFSSLTIAFVAGDTTIDGQNQAVVVMSNDGGETWGTPMNIEGMATIRDIITVSNTPDTIVAVGASSTVAGEGAYAFSPHFGQHFTTIANITGSTSPLVAVDFATNNIGLAVGAQYYTRTRDGGATWSSAVPFSGFAKITGVAFSTRSTGVIVGIDATNQALYSFTEDTGNTWTPPVAIPQFINATVNKVVFTNAANGLIAGSSNTMPVYAYTSDSGRLWSNVQYFPNFTNDTIASVSFSTNTYGVAVGKDGRLVITNSNINTWSSPLSIISGNIRVRDIAFPNVYSPY
ncbi:MAG: hypothetical protein QM528_01045 [Phycisphaerales bacterium]|nr:hypothetical protein [Phycisphaerales bacterium]